MNKILSHVRNVEVLNAFLFKLETFVYIKKKKKLYKMGFILFPTLLFFFFQSRKLRIVLLPTWEEKKGKRGEKIGGGGLLVRKC